MIKGLFIFLLLMESLTTRNFPLLLLTAVIIYFWICVFSLYDQLKIDDKIKLARYEIEIETRQIVK